MSLPANHLNPPAGLDVARVRADFPILQRTVHGKPLVYLDTAASAQRPEAVIDRWSWNRPRRAMMRWASCWSARAN